jgi:hypothetical protein
MFIVFTLLLGVLFQRQVRRQHCQKDRGSGLRSPRGHQRGRLAGELFFQKAEFSERARVILLSL